MSNGAADSGPETTVQVEKRRLLGRFDTPRPIAQALATWAIRKPNEKVLEPSVGGGVFVRSSERRLRDLGSTSPRGQIFACDIDPDACSAIVNYGWSIRQTYCDDFLLIRENRLPLVDTVIGNPPYLRLARFSREYCETVRSEMNRFAFAPGKSSLWAVFVVKAYSRLKVGGRIAFVLPEAVLHTDYGRHLLDWVSARFSSTVLISVRERCFLTEGTKERVVFALFDGAHKGPSNGARIVEYKRVEDAIRVLESDELSQEQWREAPCVNGYSIPQAISREAEGLVHQLQESELTESLGDLAKVLIGVVTGDNGFFVLSESQRLEYGLSRRHMMPIVSRFAETCKGLDVTGECWEDSMAAGNRVWLFSPSPKSVDSRVHKYLNGYDEALRLANRTFGKRESWQTPDDGFCPDAFLQYMGTSGPRMVLNSGGFNCTNSVHRVQFSGPLSRVRKRILVLSIHSSWAQLSAEVTGRTYGSAVLKLEPSEAKRLWFPAVRRYSVREVNNLWSDCEALIKEGSLDSATELIDDWLLESIRELKNLAALNDIKGLLRTVRERRVGQMYTLLK